MYGKNVFSLGLRSLLPRSLYPHRKGTTMVSKKLVDSDTTKGVKDKSEDIKYNGKESNSLKTTCPNNYISSTIKIQHLSKDIGYSIVTNRAFKQKQVLFSAVIPFSELLECPDMHSIQVAEDWHWDTSNHPIRYIQHSCFDVNCKLVLEDVQNPESATNDEANGALKQNNLKGGNFAKFKLVALQQLPPSTAATVNYNSFEWEMSSPFMDSKPPSEFVNSENEMEATKNDAADLKKEKNVSGGKGRLVQGYKYVQPDEKKFLKDHGLLLKHIEEQEKRDR